MFVRCSWLLGLRISHSMIAEITSGFLSFGILHIKTRGFEPWQWYQVSRCFLWNRLNFEQAHDRHRDCDLYRGDSFLVLPSLTLCFADAYLDQAFVSRQSLECLVSDPRRTLESSSADKRKPNRFGKQTIQETSVRFFTPGKYYSSLNKSCRAIEALTDVKTWLFALFAICHNIPTSLTNQRQPIVASFGFTNFQTTLLGCVSGVIVIIANFACTKVSAEFRSLGTTPKCYLHRLPPVYPILERM